MTWLKTKDIDATRTYKRLMFSLKEALGKEAYTSEGVNEALY